MRESTFVNKSKTPTDVAADGPCIQQVKRGRAIVGDVHGLMKERGDVTGNNAVVNVVPQAYFAQLHVDETPRCVQPSMLEDADNVFMASRA
jgi:hypothetical protein